MAAVPKFEIPGALLVEHRKAREGPDFYVVWQPGTAYVCMTGCDVVKRSRWLKSLPSGAALREWIDSIENVKPNGDVTVGAAP